METVTPPEPRRNHLDLWEAWIDVQESENQQRGTLYIIGDVPVHNHILRPFLVKKQFDANQTDELVLEIIPNIGSDTGRVVEVFYSEELESPNQYRSITIFSGSQIVVQINEIEILI